MINNFKYILASLTIVFTFVIFFVILLVDIEQQNKEVIIYLLGVLSAISTQIISYFFGSSAGSKDKSDAMIKMINGNTTDNAPA